MIRKTVKEFKRSIKGGKGFRLDTHIEVVSVETWWFLFIPIYSRETIRATNI